jgi:hypothetical protein
VVGEGEEGERLVVGDGGALGLEEGECSMVGGGAEGERWVVDEGGTVGFGEEGTLGFVVLGVVVGGCCVELGWWR